MRCEARQGASSRLASASTATIRPRRKALQTDGQTGGTEAAAAEAILCRIASASAWQARNRCWLRHQLRTEHSGSALRLRHGSSRVVKDGTGTVHRTDTSGMRSVGGLQMQSGCAHQFNAVISGLNVHKRVPLTMASRDRVYLAAASLKIGTWSYGP